jgi:hypothetical protein
LWLSLAQVRRLPNLLPESGKITANTEEALAYHSRWVRSSFPRYSKRFWGQISYSSRATLAIQYEDGEAYDTVSVKQVKGEEPLVKHSAVELQPEGVEVPSKILSKFLKMDWLVTPEGG